MACVFFKFKSGGHLKKTNTPSTAALCLYPRVHRRHPRPCSEGGTRRQQEGSAVTHGHTAASSPDKNSQPAFPRDRKVHAHTEQLPSKVWVSQPLTWNKKVKQSWGHSARPGKAKRCPPRRGKEEEAAGKFWHGNLYLQTKRNPRKATALQCCVGAGALDPTGLSPRYEDAAASLCVEVCFL